MNKPAALRQAVRKPVLILSFTMLVVSLGYSMALPVMPFYIERLGAGGREMGWLTASYAMMQFICAPLWGVLSDRIGRRPVLTAGVLGYAVTLLMFGLASSYWMLFAARSLSGILSSATMPTAMAFIGDSEVEAERSRGMGQLGAAMGLGVVIGPLFGGLLSAEILALPFFVGAGMAFLAFLLVVFVLPEPLQPVRSSRDGGLINREIRRILFTPAGALLLLVFLLSFGMTGYQGIAGLYVVHKFNFSTQQVGSMWMVMGAMLVVAQGMLVSPLTRRFGEPALIAAGCAAAALGLLGLSLAGGYGSTLAVLAFFSLALGVIGPALNAYLSRFVGDRQGTVMGLNSAAGSLGKVAGPLAAGYLYEVNIEYPFGSSAAALLLGVVVFAAGLRSRKGITN